MSKTKKENKNISKKTNKETKKDNKTKTIKLGFIELRTSKGDIISLVILIALIIAYFLSPKAFLITTGRYGQGSKEDNKNVEVALGKENTEERFEIYFQWYNVLHEIGHGVITYNGERNMSSAEEEQLVNDFAVAYWLHYGEEEKINELIDIANYASRNIKSDAKEGTNYLKYAEENWNKSSFNTFNNYGWFQFNCVKHSLEEKKTLEEVLKEMGVKDFDIPERKVLEYPEITEKTSTEIINDAIENIHSWGLEFPKAYQIFSDNPNTNNSRSLRNSFGIISLIDKLS